jgi:hypothetical protein
VNLRLAAFLWLTASASSLVSPALAAAKPDAEAVRAAVAKAVPLLEAGARGSAEKRKNCFTCHNQALPVIALTTAQARGLAVDAENLRQQLDFTVAHLARNRANYLAGKGQGGQALTAGYALLTLEFGGWASDATTAAVTEYLLRWQKDLDYWKPQSIRPPSEASLFTMNFVGLRALKKFGTEEQKERITQRTAQIRAWMLKTSAKDTEDRAFRLWALHVAEAAPEELRRAAQELLKTQREDGGWAQLPDLASDAYATGTALVALHQTGVLTAADVAYQRGLAWLLAAQRADGSWHVKTRSTPIQAYYESGYPHGDDQFISITAAGWATTALALALPTVPAKP